MKPERSKEGSMVAMRAANMALLWEVVTVEMRIPMERPVMMKRREKKAKTRRLPRKGMPNQKRAKRRIVASVVKATTT